jgi:hypothetical protein
MSEGILGGEPARSSGAIQLRLPAILVLTVCTVRLVASALMQDRPKSHKRALPDGSTRILTLITGHQWHTTLKSSSVTHPFKVTMTYFSRVQILKSKGHITELVLVSVQTQLELGFTHNTVSFRSIRRSRVTGGPDGDEFWSLSRVTKAVDEYVFCHGFPLSNWMKLYSIHWVKCWVLI